MTPDQSRQFIEDLGRFARADIHPKGPDGSAHGEWQVSRARGNRVNYHSIDDTLHIQCAVGPDRSMRTVDLASIHIWTDEDGPSIFWDQGSDGKFVRRCR